MKALKQLEELCTGVQAAKAHAAAAAAAIEKVQAQAAANPDMKYDMPKSVAFVHVQPNILIAGPGGSGKTAATLCCVRKLLGEEAFAAKGKKRNYMVIDGYRDGEGVEYADYAALKLGAKIESFISGATAELQRVRAGTALGLPEGRYKVIVIEGLDYIVPGVQQFLGKYVLETSTLLRFIFTVRNPKKLIKAMLHSCAKPCPVRLKTVKQGTFMRHILHTLHVENIGYEQVKV